MTAVEKIVRIGGASAFWGDSVMGPIQLVERAEIDYVVFDYLAEITMAILAGARRKNPAVGYATDFVEVAMKSVLPAIGKRGIKVVSNAGGINPRGCADALGKLAASMGVRLKIAVVEGDDVSDRIARVRAAGQVDMHTGLPLPEGIASANAYLGGLPIARALAAGADVVITGRCVDSAVTLGPLIHEFGWSATDYDRLAAGSLAGHIIECACQATGGLHTDWEQVPDWANIGYPVIECHADGRFVVTKPPGTGGLISVPTVAEQLLYEIGDPAAYMLPDVVCDFRNVRMTQEGENRVSVTGARGRPPTDTYKVSATYIDGFRCTGTLVIVGIEAAAKARRTGEAILARTREIFRRLGIADYTRARVDVVGAETLYGPHARTPHAREVMMRVVVDHREKQALELFAREIAPAATSWSPGTTGFGGGRPSASPLIKQFSFTLPKRDVAIRIEVGGRVEAVDVPVEGGYRPAPEEPEPIAPAPPRGGPTREVPLSKLAYARSGDKGNLSNIGIIARRPEYLPLLLAQLTPAKVKEYFAHLVQGEVKRYLLPGINACNFLLYDALDGGGLASMRSDPLGKGMGQIMLDMTVQVPEAMAAQL